jgi:hypothetical protein
LKSKMNCSFHLTQSFICIDETLVKGVIQDLGPMNKIVHNVPSELDCLRSHIVDFISRHALEFGELMDIISTKLFLINGQSRFCVTMLKFLNKFIQPLSSN